MSTEECARQTIAALRPAAASGDDCEGQGRRVAQAIAPGLVDRMAQAALKEG
jgi:hypothetical protein